MYKKVLQIQYIIFTTSLTSLCFPTSTLWAVSQCKGDVSCTEKRSEKYLKSCETTAVVGLKHYWCTMVLLLSVDLFFSHPVTLPYQTYELLYMSIKIEFNTKYYPTFLSRLLLVLDHYRYHLLNATIWSWHALVCIAIVFNQYQSYHSNIKKIYSGGL